VTTAERPEPQPAASSLHDMPSAEALVESVREWLERDVLAGTTGRLQFHTRVAVNVLAMVERELRLGAGQAAAHAIRLAQLGCADDAELAARIRDGSLDGRLPEVRELVWADVRDKLAVANPKYLDGA
jgi:phosphosulfolactate phosphohydrolase-like enzyme